MTSPPAPTPIPSSARWSAAVAELRAIAWRAPTLAANCSSNALVRGPVVSQPESSTSMTALFSRSVIDARANGRNGGSAGVVIGRAASPTDLPSCNEVWPRPLAADPNEASLAVRT